MFLRLVANATGVRQKNNGNNYFLRFFCVQGTLLSFSCSGKNNKFLSYASRETWVCLFQKSWAIFPFFLTANWKVLRCSCSKRSVQLFTAMIIWTPVPLKVSAALGFEGSFTINRIFRVLIGFTIVTGTNRLDGCVYNLVATQLKNEKFFFNFTWINCQLSLLIENFEEFYDANGYNERIFIECHEGKTFYAVNDFSGHFWWLIWWQLGTTFSQYLSSSLWIKCELVFIRLDLNQTDSGCLGFPRPLVN